MNRLQNKVKSNWIIPHGQLDKKTVVVVKINREGKILNLNVTEKSGDDEFDQNSLAAIYQSVPFEDIPENIKDDNLTINFTFSQDDFEAISIPEITNSDVISQKTIINSPIIPISNNPTTQLSNSSTIKEKEQTYVKEASPKTCKVSTRKVPRSYSGPVTPKTCAAGVLSLLVWPGIGQLVNDGPSEKAGVHAILGLITIFRLWSCYDAIVDRQEGPI